ncbi:uncharacterized protein LOC123228350 isoform X3 [Mangifera indica]|uniref:uncharacterized protein LOC123228350 isoform X3 n=1 Tax=Mangifera indica TaxID=29780 RepID=UPI001CF93723|nr:uncharacterized protein LOC123228350 isoform X3 [Mangifera indica]
MSGTVELKDQEMVDRSAPEESQKSMPLSEEEEAAVKKKYGGIMPKKPPLISKDHERAYFDSADWALGKQGVSKPKGPLEALRPKLQAVRSGFVCDFNKQFGDFAPTMLQFYVVKERSLLL